MRLKMKLYFDQLEVMDFPKIINWIDPDIFHIFKVPVDDKQLELLLSKVKDGIQYEIGMKILDKETDQIVGLIHSIINNKNNSMHIQQLIVNPEMRNHGIGSTILKMFLNYCFKEYGFHRIQLFTEENNKQAIACYKKVGFHLDGILRDLVKTGTGYLSSYVFSMLHNEWIES